MPTLIDLTAPGAESAPINGAIITDTSNVGSGTGTYDTFLAIGDNDGNEAGFNADSNDPSNPDIGASKTHTLQIGNLTITNINGIDYYEFRVDLNEVTAGDNENLSLDQLKLYVSSDGTLNSLTDLAGASLVYDMDAGGDKTVLLSQDSSGSGTDDYSIFIPVSAFAGHSITDYVYFYADMGEHDVDGFDASDGFEEFRALTQDFVVNPEIHIEKEASGFGDCADVVGETITYTYTVTNPGNVGIDNIVLTDDFSDATPTFVSGDTGSDGILGVGETWTYTAYHVVTQTDIDDNGNYDNDLDLVNDSLRNVGTVTGDSVFDDTQVTDNDDAIVEVCQNPAIQVVKDASGFGDCADIVGETITYTYTVTNEGNVGLENVVLVDDFSDVTPSFVSGDTGSDGVLSVGETWTYTAYHVVTQDDINDNGNYDSDDPADGINDSIRNVATVTADALVTGDDATDDDDAIVDVCQYPTIDIEKNVKTDKSGGFVPADDPDGPAASTSTTVDFQVIVTNTGNVDLTDITLSDSVVHTVGGVSDPPVAIDYSDPSLNAFIDINNSGDFDPGEEWTNFDTDGDGTLDDADGDSTTDDDFILAAGDSFTIYYSLTSLLGQHENTAVVNANAVTTGEAADEATDDANYYVLANEECVGVRTPGFWANTKWMTFWDGIGDGWGTPANEPKQAGTPGFADGELLYKVFLTDSNHDGVINGDPTDGIADDAFSTGLLIGDYNKNGITDAGEDTIFISLTDAVKLINASSKQLADGKTADGIFMLGRDVVATWLNYLANNQGTTDQCIGPVDSGDGTNTPREYLDAAIDWFQQFASTTNGNPAQNLVNTYHDGNAQAIFEFDQRIAPSSVSWQNIVTQGQDLPVSAAAMHSALDGYNNTGAIGGVEYCCDADSELALSVLAQINNGLLI